MKYWIYIISTRIIKIIYLENSKSYNLEQIEYFRVCSPIFSKSPSLRVHAHLSVLICSYDHFKILQIILHGKFSMELVFFSTLFQIIRYFDFSRYIVFAIHLNIHYM